MATSADRIAVILPPEERDLAEQIAAATGGGSKGGVSHAIRLAIREAAEERGFTPRKRAVAAGKKNRPSTP
jgi:hypothetical protein